MGTPTEAPPVILPELLALLRCPQTQQPLTVAGPEVLARLPGVSAALVREDGLVAYPVRGGIPVLLTDEAMSLTLVG